MQIDCLTSIAAASLISSLLLGIGARTVGAQQMHHPTSRNGSYTERGTRMTVSLTRRVTDTRGSEFLHPGRGKEWEWFYVVLRNGGSSGVDYNPFDFHLVDQMSQSWDQAFASSDNFEPQFHSGKRPPHQMRAGWIVFEIPRSTRTGTMMWDKPQTFDDQATVGRYRLP